MHFVVARGDESNLQCAKCDAIFEGNVTLLGNIWGRPDFGGECDNTCRRNHWLFFGKLACNRNNFGGLGWTKMVMFRREDTCRGTKLLIVLLLESLSYNTAHASTTLDRYTLKTNKTCKF